MNVCARIYEIAGPASGMQVETDERVIGVEYSDCGVRLAAAEYPSLAFGVRLWKRIGNRVTILPALQLGDRMWITVES